MIETLPALQTNCLGWPVWDTVKTAFLSYFGTRLPIYFSEISQLNVRNQVHFYYICRSTCNFTRSVIYVYTNNVFPDTFPDP